MLDILTTSSSQDDIERGISSLCPRSGDSCFMVGGREDTFSLEHFQGECDYVVRGDWLDMSSVHMATPSVQTLLKTSSCSVLMDMAKVRSELMLWAQVSHTPSPAEHDSQP